MERLLFPVSIMCLVIFLLIFLLKKFNQPYLIAYILAGIVLGPHVTAILTDSGDISVLGEIGILLLMFFLGMDIDVPDHKSLLFKPVFAQGLKTVLGVTVAIVISRWAHWNHGIILLLSVLFAFNSTAVVSELLHRNNEIKTDIGKTMLNILVLQDVMLAPALTILQLTRESRVQPSKLIFSSITCIFIFFLFRAIRNRDLYQVPLIAEMEKDHELQVFFGALLCLGFGLLASLAGLSAPVGSFTAGLCIGRTNAFKWLEASLKPFKVFFTALFFVSVGLAADLPYISKHFPEILGLTMLILLLNSLFSATVFRSLGYRWKTSLNAGAMLSQTGEFSMLACSLAYQSGIIDTGFLKAGLAVIILSLLLSTLWTTCARNLLENLDVRLIR